MSYQNNIFNQQNHAQGWNFMDCSTTSQQQQSTDAPLQEPVAFEDFQFSLGLDPEFAMPIPLDIPPPPPINESDLFNMEVVPAPMNHAVLDEQDHKAFSQFLDQFFVDPNMQIDPQFTMYPPPMSLDNHHPYQNSEEEYHRQSSILQSLDEQKRYYNKSADVSPQYHQQNHQYQDRPGAVYLQQSNSITAPFIKPPILRESSLPKQQADENENSNSPKSNYSSSTHGNNGNQNSSGSSSGGGGAIRRGKPHKELLTEEEKRNNHIASEQKRRSMIRSGFKDLTEIVPTLKNINNSKSTVLFKAVDYIKYLDKRNRNLREKIKNLEVRVEVEGRMGILNRPTSLNTISSSNAHSYYKPSSMSTSSPSALSSTVAAPQRVESNTVTHNNTTTTNNSKSASAALLQHKTQQKQLMELQEKLQLHQKMLAQQQQQQQKAHTTQATADINRPYQIYDQPHLHHHHRWHNEKTAETKMEVDASSSAPTDSLIKATVSA